MAEMNLNLIIIIVCALHISYDDDRSETIGEDENMNGPWIPCNEFKVCSENDRTSWKSKRSLYDHILLAKEASEMGSYVDRNSSLALALANRFLLCEDKAAAPFLMNKDSDDWQIGCLWTGGDSLGTCAPAPSPSETFSYIESKEWSKKLQNFRRSIGCSKTQIKSAEEVGELYICRERCLDLGLGYYQSIILSLGSVFFMVAIMLA